ncbi:MAG TPA: hypothetical protein PLF22_09335, partial [Pseudomonadales bacterium]|nr:hypothetical protein [Pseudomonadales bacterium]
MAELVSNSGYAVPGRMLETEEAINARGFWESQDVVDFNERFLSESGSAWFDLDIELGEKWYNDSSHTETIGFVSGFLKKSLQEEVQLVIKDPRLCYLLPAWLKTINKKTVDIRFIWVNRNAAAVSGSLNRRDGFSSLTGGLIWLRHFFCGLQSIKKFPCLLLDYDSLLEEKSTRKVIADFLQCDPLTPKKWSSIVNPGLKRNASSDMSGSSVFDLAVACSALIKHGKFVDEKFWDGFQSLSMQYDDLCSQSSEWIAALSHANRELVAARRQAMDVGRMHSQALGTIADKEEQIDENIRYINQCHLYLAECEEKRLELDRLKELRDHHLEVIKDREQKIVENVAYIQKCELRLAELHEAVVELDPLRNRLAEVEATLKQREMDIVRNASYIEKCEEHITELDSALEHSASIRERLAEVEATLQERD